MGHARALALAHGDHFIARSPSPLRRRFTRARERIALAYQSLTRDAKSRREPSPAEEWLLDNASVVEDQIREIAEDLPFGYLIELPRVAAGVMRGYPRVYGLCLDYLRHTDARVDPRVLTQFVQSYQSVARLTIGELWAVPIMLRLGLILTVGALAASEVRSRDRDRADVWADRLFGASSQPETNDLLVELEKERDAVSASFLVQLLRRMREHEGSFDLVRDWAGQRAAAMGTSPEELVRRDHLRQAADQISVGNAITSMRAVTAVDWDEFFEHTSEVEAVLRRDPADAYARSDRATRDRYRHVVEDVARRGALDELSVAQEVLTLAQAGARAATEPDARAHVGFYLVDEGRFELERRARYRPGLRTRVVRAISRTPNLFYFGAFAAFTAALLGSAALTLSEVLEIDVGFFLLMLALALPVSEIAVGLVNCLVVSVLPPRLLPKLDFERGIAPEHRTLVVVPALIDHPETIDQLIDDLEVRSLANPDPNLYFALATDFADSPEPSSPSDEALLARTQSGIARLNRARAGGEPRYFLFHRRRVHAESEGRHMGLERKRGKLEELNRLLLGEGETTFSVVTAPVELLRSIRYVITLDADTDLPRGAGHKLVATLAHPLNRPVLDPESRRVERGYGVIQPRVGTLPASARRSRFSAILAGPSGIDPYTTAVSDTYQDLFGEGSYVGKGIYDVAAFQRALEGRVPPGQLLSHDLFEGIFARAALATDIEVLDEQPAAYDVQVARQHRWVRGDWQLLPWLLPRVPAPSGWRPNDLRPLDRWKIADNLRRSLLSVVLVPLVALSWFLHERVLGTVLAVFAGVFVVPLCARLLLSVTRPSNAPSRSFTGSLGGDLRSNTPQLMLRLIFALDEGWVCLDATARSLYRQLVSRRNLLEWTTMRQAAARARSRAARRLWIEAAVCLVLLVLVALLSPRALPFALPLLALWMASPLVAASLARPVSRRLPSARVCGADRELLRLTARKTWRFFDAFVTEADNFLPPDNFQEDPRGVVAHRTSPTNIGLYLLSVVSARDMYYLTLSDAAERLRQTLGTLEELEKREGHVLNWYDTMTLRPLEPQYVSTVDSGNLAAYLWTLREACADLARAPIADGRVILAARDAVQLALGELQREGERSAAEPELRRVARQLDELLSAGELGGESIAEALRAAARSVAACRDSDLVRELATEPAYWLSQAELTLARALDELSTLRPWQGELPPALSALPGAERDELRRELARCLAAHTAHDIAVSGPKALELVGALRASLAQLEADAGEQGRAELELRELELGVERAARGSEQLVAALSALGERAAALADAMNFGFLFDEQRELFAIGYNVSSARLDGSHYDLLASEARLGSMFCIAKGDVFERHWFRLGRPRARAGVGRALLSWSGSMFEYLMPLLVMRNNPGTLLEEGYEVAIERQRRYAAERGVPWGISESAYNVMDLRMTYQYRAFGVPGLGLKAGLGEDLVVAPYATVLAGLVRPELIAKNLRALAKEGLDGPYGFYESIDYTPEHVPPGRRGIVVKAFFSHHQGMTLVALDNILNDDVMQHRFHRDARIKATELVLEERVPSYTPEAASAAMAVPMAHRVEPRVDVAEQVGLRGAGPMRVHLLGHGELSSLASVTGVGVTTWKGLDVNRFREEPLLEAGGIYFYVKNLSAARLWSAAYQPTRAEPSFYNVAFSIDRVEYHRRDGDVQTVTEITVSPEHPVELRRITLTNQSSRATRLEVTSYTEVVLASRGADVSHRAFGNMFVQTEALPERGALMARRRPRLAGEPEVWVVQVLLPETGAWGALDFDSSRESFLGRGRSTDEPQALSGEQPLAKRTGHVLDPALALRRGIELQSGASARLALITGLASSRDEALGLIETYSVQHSILRAIELGWAGVRVELRHLGITAVEVHRFQRLLSAVISPHPALRTVTPLRSEATRGRNALWAQGISGDLPIVLCRIDSAEFSELCRDLVLAHEFWRLNGFSSDLVFINEEPSGYLQPTQDSVRELIRNAAIDQRGGVFLRRADQMSDEERELLACTARIVLVASQGSLARQLRRAVTARPLPETLSVARESRLEPMRSPSMPPVELQLDTGLGGFADAGARFVMSRSEGRRAPAPWCNVMANPRFGTLVTDSGSSFTWYENSQRHRLTPWSNDPVSDPSGELFYVRDDADGSVWSLTPEPAGAGAEYRVSHGQGRTAFVHERRTLAHEIALWVSPSDPVKCARVTIRNLGKRPRRLSLYGVIEWVLGNSRETSRVSIASSFEPELGALFAANPLSVFPGHRAFFCATSKPASFTADREEFFGVSGSRRMPEALERAALSDHASAGLDPCAALHLAVVIEPGQTAEVGFLLGQAESAPAARALIARYLEPSQFQHSEREALRAWDDILGTISVKTPDAALDVLANRWLLYQSLSSRVWGRTGFYQSSGAFGFRDQLQDVLAVLHARPALAREHLLRCAARQFSEGDVQHWWHAETGEGLRTRCSDDMLWLPYATAEYVRVTGDRAVLDERVPFLVERALGPEEEDLFSSPASSEEQGTLYEHCVRALDAGTTSGPRGLPTMRGGDWNDGMNRVGHEGRGESIWLAWFLARTLQDFAPLALARGDRERASFCDREVGRLRRAVEHHGWDGEWYRRAYFDAGTTLGSKQDAECSIDAIAQSWAVISGIADPQRAARAVGASEERLIREADRLMCLLAPPFNHTVPDPGYIQAYPPGVRENGGQYTHGVLWTIVALAQLGEGDRAYRLLSLMNPITHGQDPELMRRYRVEPYVVAADVYASPEHPGRGGWTWYTGSAGWFYRVIIESLLGIRRRGQVLEVSPCIPTTWSGFDVEYRAPAATTYRIRVSNPEQVSTGVVRVEVDGKVMPGGRIRLASDGSTHEAVIVLGRAQHARAPRDSRMGRLGT